MAEFDRAFNLLDQATTLDSDPRGFPNVPEIISKYRDALDGFSNILSSGAPLDANVRNLIQENIQKYNARVEELYQQLPVACAEAKLVDDDVQECRIEKDDSLPLAIANLVVEEDWEVMAEAKDDDPDGSERGSSISGDADAKELQQRHKQRQEQR